MIGREEIVTTLVTQLSHQRLVTVVGPGGIGKTTVGLYAIQKLDESGERERIARCHAESYRDLFERAEAEAPARTTTDWLADYAPEIDNLRAALDSAFYPLGNRSIGVALTNAAFPLSMPLSLLEECSSRAKGGA
jgi:predicted ATPase